MNRSTTNSLRPVLLAGVTLVGACGSDLVLPEDPGGAARTLALAAAAGDSQRGPVAQLLPDPVVARVVDGTGQPVSGVGVVFVLGPGSTSADLSPDTAVTDADGRASARWMLGTLAGTQTVEAHLAAQPAGPPSAAFVAVAQAGPPDSLVAVRGDGQSGLPAAPLADSLVVRVADRYGNPVAGTLVHWRVASGQGALDARDVATGADGRAAVVWTLGFSFRRQTVEASIDGGAAGSPVRFQADIGS
jgi:hypothetical protein